MRDGRYTPGAGTGTLVLLAATAVALVSAGGGGPDGPASQETAHMAAVAQRAAPATARRVERLRGLDFETVPNPEVITSAELGRFEQRELRRRDPRPGLAADEATARIAGLLAGDEELENAFGSSEELAAAAYDPRGDRLFLVEDSAVGSPAFVEFILAHELTHALEDQHFGLGDPAAIENDDAALALLALTEGTATALMVDYGIEHLSPLDLAAIEVDESTGDVPSFVVDQLEWTYFGGMRFVKRLHELADGWKLVDYALAHRAPASTEQVLHPVKYVRDERPVRVAIDSGGLRHRGWRLADSGSIGELATRKLLELGQPGDAAGRAAAGWDGDRFELWRADVAPAECAGTCRGELVLAMKWQLETTADAADLANALGRYARDGLDGYRTGGAFQLDDGALAIDGAGATATAVFAPTRALAEAVAGDQLGG
ncbi:MAG TPA: hypothetical protein VHF58_05360 [Solirubrobacterales bacterium]|nr:hypothetical protein [Solirubrobacterales bacterium]